MKKQLLSLSSLIIVLALFLSGCGPKEVTSETAVDAPGETLSTDSFLLAEVPQGARNLNAALETAEPGETIIVTGRVGGTVEPLSENFAGFVLTDEVIVFCDEMSDKDHCLTPWDACCEDPEKIAASRAFVQFVGADGMPLPVNLRDATGLKENDQVTVQGYLSPDSTPGNRILIATGISIGG